MRVVEYNIICGDTAEKVIARVDDLLTLGVGWQPQGGIAFHTYTYTRDGYTQEETTYAQAMVRCDNYR